MGLIHVPRAMITTQSLAGAPGAVRWWALSDLPRNSSTPLARQEGQMDKATASACGSTNQLYPPAHPPTATARCSVPIAHRRPMALLDRPPHERRPRCSPLSARPLSPRATPALLNSVLTPTMPRSDARAAHLCPPAHYAKERRPSAGVREDADTP